MHRIKEIYVDVPGQDQRIPKALFSYFSMKCLQWGYSLEAALSNVYGSFTLSRLMKRPKTFCDPACDEYPQLTLFFFVKYTASVSAMFKPIRRRTLTLFKC